MKKVNEVIEKKVTVIVYSELTQEIQKGIASKGISVKVFDTLTQSVKRAIVGSIEKELKTSKVVDSKEFLRLEKMTLKASYKGLFSIFNLIKKESTKGFALSIKGKDFQAVSILGNMTFNEFVAQMYKGGGYSFDQIFKCVSQFDKANDGDKVTISERGAIINGLIMGVKNNEIAPNEAIESFVSLMGQPFRVNKKGEKTLLIGVSSAKYLKANALEIFNRYDLATIYATELLEVVISEGLIA